MWDARGCKVAQEGLNLEMGVIASPSGGGLQTNRMGMPSSRPTEVLWGEFLIQHQECSVGHSEPPAPAEPFLAGAQQHPCPRREARPSLHSNPRLSEALGLLPLMAGLWGKGSCLMH